MTSGQDSCYVCFWEQLLWWLRSHPENDFCSYCLNFITVNCIISSAATPVVIQCSLESSKNGSNWCASSMRSLTSELSLWRRVVSSPHSVHWTDAIVLLLIPLYDKLHQICACCPPINHMYSLPFPFLELILLYSLYLSSWTPLKPSQSKALPKIGRRIEWKPLQNYSESHGWSTSRFNIICKCNLVLLS